MKLEESGAELGARDPVGGLRPIFSMATQEDWSSRSSNQEGAEEIEHIT